MNLFNTSHILQEKRYSWIDYDKGISIILVGYGHCLITLTDDGIQLDPSTLWGYIGIFLYGFRMPLFFIISGIFLSGSLSRKGMGGYIYGRTNNILYPLLIWGFIQISLQSAFIYAKSREFDAIHYLDLIIRPRRVGIGHFWYLNTLFFLGIIYVFLKIKLRVKWWIQIALGLILYFIASFVHVNKIELGMLVDICQFYIFFAIGDTISSITLDERNARRYASLKIFFPLFIAFLFIQHYIADINIIQGNGDTGFVEYNRPGLFLIAALVGCALSMNVSFQLQKYKLAKFLRIIGYNSLFIYCMQIIVMMITSLILVKVLKIVNIPLLVTAVLASGIAIPMIIYNLCLKFNLWRLFSFKKPVREIDALKGTAGSHLKVVPAPVTVEK